MTMTNLCIKPVDVLFLRGNKLFGGSGEHGEALMPPWPSVFTGAICSRLLADNNLLGKAAAMGNDAPALIDELVGQLTLEFITIVDIEKNELYFPAPADIVFGRNINTEDRPYVHVVKPVNPAALTGCASSSQAQLSAPAGIRSASQVKPDSGWWLSSEGMKKHLSGEKLEPRQLFKTSTLWKTDPRLGIALDPASRTADKGRIYTSDTVAMGKDVGFAASFRHEKGALPTSGLVRLGGDGRGAEISSFDKMPIALGRPQTGWKKFRLILSTPCPSPNGWLPPGVVEKEKGIYVLETSGLRARLYSAAVARYEVISGWDVAKHAPKPALKMIPAGSVFWFELEQGDSSALEGIWKDGLLAGIEDKQYAGRRREGFGRVWFGKA